MSVSLVLTVLGEDAPGLVKSLAAEISRHDGNWVESRMSRLAGRFAGIVRVTVPEAHADALLEALSALQSGGLQVMAQRGAGAAEVEAAEPPPWVLELTGVDHPGIVREVSAALARRGVNVVDLATEITAAPMSGEPLFRARARLHLPDGVEAEELRAELERVAQTLIVDITLADSE